VKRARPPPHRLRVLAAIVVLAPSLAHAGYREPPPEVARFLEAPRSPRIALAPRHRYALLAYPEPMPPVATLARATVSVDGIAIDPHSLARRGLRRYSGLAVIDMATMESAAVELPAGARTGMPVWAPDGSRFAFTMLRANRLELWVGEGETAGAQRVRDVVVSQTLGAAFRWMPDSKRLLCRLLPENRGPPPATSPVMAPGPLTSDTSTATPSRIRTVQHTSLASDESRRHAYYLSSQLALVDVATGQVTRLGAPGIFERVEPSPDGAHLLVSRKLLPAAASPEMDGSRASVEVWDAAGTVLRELAGLSLAPNVRGHRWHAMKPASVLWVEAAAHEERSSTRRSDRVVVLEAPFAGPPSELFRLQHRFAGIDWMAESDLALVREYESRRRMVRTWLVAGETQHSAPRLVWEHSPDEQYRGPGRVLLRSDRSGNLVVAGHRGSIYVAGLGASPAGERPFLDRVDLATLRGERIWESSPGSFETVVALFAESGPTLLVRHESALEPVGYYILDLRGQSRRWLTRSRFPAHPLQGVQRRVLTYRRADGVALSATLYLPDAYEPGRRLPLVLCAYPRNFSSREMAEQIAFRAHRHPRLAQVTSLWFLTQGYAVLHPVSIPIIGDGDAGNDTFIEQIVAGASAAVDAVVGMGVADPNRIGIVGHSYGAALAAHLLTHTDLFAAGIALSGAYDRTATPFGFQTEPRTLWEARDTYLAMSAYLHADRIDEPLLLLHGADDDHYGTNADQSRRMYRALAAHNARARLVLLPFEGHTVRGRESVKHTLAEMFDWFDENVKHRSAVSDESDL
jgi:dipeptidyl aminopeptidase/acylaminoacyl peptidase